ncbi:hypothetical protein [Lentilactobacillus parakefiri]|uniref:Uncharacterized protein n=1 Tax=Lentilactobacillus parakefiri TaxID=152332 RepID=A0A269Y3U3_9LACO|nr:hypothetical protein [Lentilactobacillus parakefiri]PAK79801.1 hypothetical protein B8W98_09460 [Lentilactobacillus parakefiri]TDG91229.1 hypothetical protein C5L28_002431 [Lentilactobacillus parakefiri]GAW71861.1 hypothetical protein LPKJCM_00964 [Lentilactobacillus parakefiri]
MKAQSIICGGLLFVVGVAVGMHADHFAHEMHHMHHHGPHTGSGHFHHDQPFEDIGDLPYVRETRSNGEGLRNEI